MSALHTCSFLTVALTLHSLAQFIAVERGTLLLSQCGVVSASAPLPDVFHGARNHTRVRHAAHIMSESIVGISLILLGASAMARRSAQPVVHFITLLSIAFALRSMCMMCTTLPDASQQCTPNVCVSVTRRGGQLSVKTGSCHDLMFSGHMSCTVLALLLSALYCPRRGMVAAVAALLLVQSIAIPVSCNHYTVDVLVALIVCSLLVAVSAQKISVHK
jgi:hypothetical protein